MLNSTAKYLVTGMCSTLAIVLLLGICPVVFRLQVESPTPARINYVSGQTILSREIPAGTHSVEFIVPFRLIEPEKTVFIDPEKQNGELSIKRFEIVFCKIRLCGLSGADLEKNWKITHDKWLRSDVVTISKGRKTLMAFYIPACLLAGIAAMGLLWFASRFPHRKDWNRIRQILLCFCFWGLLVIPCLVWPALPREIREMETYENRIPVSFPEFSSARIIDFFSAFDNYYARNFPFRPMALQFHQYVSTKLGLVEKSRNIRGTIPNWYYFERDIPDFVGNSHFTPEEMNRIVRNIEQIRQYFKKRNIGFLILIPPNKIQVYPDYLPPELKNRKAAETRCSEMMKFLKLHFADPPLRYLDRPLFEYKDKGVLLYYPNDTHWNMFGAYVAFSRFAPLIDPGLKVPSPEEIPWKMEPVTFGDLGRAHLPYNALFPDNGMNIATTRDVQLAFSAEKRVQHSFNPAAPSSRKLIVFHDSFFVPVQPYFRYFFREVHFYANAEPDYWQIEKEKPDMVILQIVERNIQTLLRLSLPPE